MELLGKQFKNFDLIKIKISSIWRNKSIKNATMCKVGRRMEIVVLVVCINIERRGGGGSFLAQKCAKCTKYYSGNHQKWFFFPGKKYDSFFWCFYGCQVFEIWSETWFETWSEITSYNWPKWFDPSLHPSLDLRFDLRLDLRLVLRLDLRLNLRLDCQLIMYRDLRLEPSENYQTIHKRLDLRELIRDLTKDSIQDLIN